MYLAYVRRTGIKSREKAVVLILFVLHEQLLLEAWHTCEQRYVNHSWKEQTGEFPRTHQPEVFFYDSQQTTSSLDQRYPDI